MPLETVREAGTEITYTIRNAKPPRYSKDKGRVTIAGTVTTSDGKKQASATFNRNPKLSGRIVSHSESKDGTLTVVYVTGKRGRSDGARATSAQLNTALSMLTS